MVRSIRSLCLFAALSVTLSACQTGTEPSTAVRMQLAATVFQRPIPEPAVVQFTITNVSAQRVYLPHCGSRVMTAIDQYAGGQWSQISSDACLTNVDMSPLPLEPGASLTSSASIGVVGRFRLRAGATTDPQQPYTWNVGLVVFDVH
jgi:hypothetical protein